MARKASGWDKGDIFDREGAGMDAVRWTSLRTTVSVAVVTAVCSAGAVLLLSHQSAHDGGQTGVRLLGSDQTQGSLAAGHEHSTPPGWSHGDKVGWQGAKVPPGWSHGTPPGWSHGDKAGWHGAHVPPAWSKAHKHQADEARPDGDDKPGAGKAHAGKTRGGKDGPGTGNDGPGRPERHERDHDR
jgi:hypothetical protein